MLLSLFKRRKPFPKANWTPRALEVFATAKALAAPTPITTRHLLLAIEAANSEASQALKKLGIVPSAVLGCPAPAELLPNGELFVEDFDEELQRNLLQFAVAEAKSMGWMYLGTESLLLSLARIGVTGVALPYDKIRQTFPQPG